MSFLPEDYTPPKTSNGYMKIQEGENKIRILSAPILGWEDWDNKKPVRFRYENKPEKQLDPKVPIKHFWSFIVWNYSSEQIQILHITQASIRNKLQSLSKDADWGDPYFYDIKIIKKGEGKDTEYDVNPLPHKELSPSIEESFREKPICLEALFDNVDPFDKNHKYPTAGIFKKTKVESMPQEKRVTDKDVEELCSILAACSPQYQTAINDYFKQKNIDMNKLSVSDFVRLRTKAIDERQKYSVMNAEAVPF